MGPCNKIDTVIRKFNFISGVLRSEIINRMERCPKCNAPLDAMELGTNPCSIIDGYNMMLFCRRELECGWQKVIKDSFITYLGKRGFNKDYIKLLKSMTNIYDFYIPKGIKKKHQNCGGEVVEVAELKGMPKENLAHHKSGDVKVIGE